MKPSGVGIVFTTATLKNLREVTFLLEVTEVLLKHRKEATVTLPLAFAMEFQILFCTLYSC